MRKTAVATVLIFALLLSATSILLSIKLASAQNNYIEIRADGNVYPSSAPIQRIGDIYYVTNDTGSIFIARNNMTLDGQGHKVQGETHLPIGSTQFTQTNEITGISISNNYNTTVKNFSIENCRFGVSLENSSSITLSGLNITGTWNDMPFSMFPAGIFMWHSNNNNITGNRLDNNEYGIYLGEKCTQNLFAGNTISNSKHEGIILYDSSGNTFYHNNFNNAINFYDSGLDHYGVSLRALNTWDNGKEGNYWSDYNGTDSNEEGLGDIPYRINLQNADNFPFMEPFNNTYYLLKTTLPKVSLLSPLNWVYNGSSVPLVFNVDKAVNWTSYSLDAQKNVTLSGDSELTDLPNGLHNITVYSQDTFGNIGSSNTISFTVAKPELEPFPIVTVVIVSVALAAVVVAAGLLVYFKKHKSEAVYSRNLYLKNGVSSETFTKTFFRQEKIRWVEDSS